MFSLLQESLPHLIHTYGAWVVGGVVMLECLGLPVPGETALISAAIFAGTTHRLGIVPVILAAAIAASVGGAIGYWIGRAAGYPLALRYGSYIGLSESRLKLGQYLFLRHGGKIVFFSRFIAVLRALGALLAGVNRMDWRRFVLFNTAGAVAWATLFGTAAYALGREVHHVEGPVGIAVLVVIGIGVIAAIVVARRQHGRMQAAAERAFPGPLRPAGRHALERRKPEPVRPQA
jgi:membrane protein DedA with SNARE-associated domain